MRAFFKEHKFNMSKNMGHNPSLPSQDARGNIYHSSAFSMTRSEREMALIDVGIVSKKNTPFKRVQATKGRKPSRGHKDHPMISSAPKNERKESVVMLFVKKFRGKNPRAKYTYEFMPSAFIHVVECANGDWEAFVPFTKLYARSSDKVKAVSRLLGMPKWYLDRESMQWTSAKKEHKHTHMVWGRIEDHKRTLPLSPVYQFQARTGKRSIIEVYT